MILEADLVAKHNRFARIPEAVLYDPRLSSHAVRVYGVLDRHADPKTGECWPGQARIGELAHLSRTSVWAALVELVEAGYVEKVRRGRTLTNHYRVMFAQRASPDLSDVHNMNKGCSPYAQSDVHETHGETGADQGKPSLNESQRNESQETHTYIREGAGAEAPTRRWDIRREIDRVGERLSERSDELGFDFDYLGVGFDEATEAMGFRPDGTPMSKDTRYELHSLCEWAEQWLDGETRPPPFVVTARRKGRKAQQREVEAEATEAPADVSSVIPLRRVALQSAADVLGRQSVTEDDL